MGTILGSGQFKVDGSTTMAKLYSAKEIRAALKRYVQSDTWFTSEIKKHLLRRLKYATGKLYDSIQFDYDVQIRSRKNGYYITISVVLLDTELLPALLSEKETKTLGIKENVPTTQTLIEYVESKRKYFNDAIRNKKEEALNIQRQKLLKTQESNIAHIQRHGAGFRQEFKDPVEEVAIEIRRAISRRLSNKKPATRGSTRILLGFVQQSLRRLRRSKKQKIKNERFAPYYKTENPALFTVNNENKKPDEIGVINQSIKSMLDRFANQFFSERMDKLMETGYTLDDVVSNVFNEVPQYDKMVKSLAILDKTLDTKKGRLAKIMKRTMGDEGEKTKQAIEAISKISLKAAEMEHLIRIEQAIPQASEIKKEIDKANAEAKKIAIRIMGRQLKMSRGRSRDELKNIPRLLRK